jgi:hypothetical protein
MTSSAVDADSRQGKPRELRFNPAVAVKPTPKKPETPVVDWDAAIARLKILLNQPEP